MAPISTELMGLALTEQPEAAFLSILIVFILSIALLLMCTTCQKHSFELEQKAPTQNSSNLVRVATKGEGGSQNPAANEITSDEIGNLEISPEGLPYKAWRSHTLIRDSTYMNGNADGSVTLQGI
ncbi:uncharacterized protein [Misgurnus anguillicaudatus]|uniref:uncharacterized protein n=1 Tax=Misgurnus anguillicaudatus TaxID=75329 RepID=UPI0024357C2A|nr:uncharacterized protein si:ch73-204p21.2 [Misgurnus anguillicaudatus]